LEIKWLQKLVNLINILGVIDVPEITHHLITNDDKFVVICSDGVWEFL
jgi:serine/threonine protein phosphatase PrpC